VNWPDLIGILGFVLSVVVFSLTRWERRKILIIDFECSSGEINGKFKNEAGDYNETMLIIHVMNTGARPIVIDKNSIKLIGSKRNVNIYDTDWFGLDNIPRPLNPGTNFEIGLFLESFRYFQGYTNFSYQR